MTLSVDSPQLHPTTQCCLEALQWLHSAQHQFSNILDVGCGSGLLTIVSAGLWSNADVLACDIASQAVSDTAALSQNHNLEARVTVIRSDGLKHDTIKNRSPYDLILCNLLAEPIIRWAPDMHAHSASDSICVLSGILAWFEGEVKSAYESAGFELIHSIPRSPWVTLILRRQ